MPGCAPLRLPCDAAVGCVASDLTVHASFFLQVVQKAADIQEAISEGANSFLFTEYKYLGVFMVRLQLSTWRSASATSHNPCLPACR
jgi:Na+/H+-translocating membrane pyrophosphatase